MVRFATVFSLVLGCLVFPSFAVDQESAAQRHARDAVKTLRQRSALPSECETVFLKFWRVFVGPGPKGMVKTPTLQRDGEYFGFGSITSEPLLEEAERVCARQTGARGDLVVLVLKEREHKKWRRLKKLQHAERIIGY